MGYAVKEIFYTLQGEGAQTGRAAVFCRFAGCNLWSGREEDRAEAKCRFCDTDFVGVDGEGGGKFETAEGLADAIEQKWPADSGQHGIGLGKRFVVCTGGEPLLQLDAKLIAALHGRDFEIAVETNGTIAAPEGLDWLTVSPKAGSELKQRSGDELKLVFPQLGVDPAQFEALAFRHFFVQPMDGPSREAFTGLALRYCLDHPQWRLSLQTHKLLGIP
jgi:7-carboxy-7-deazaguanine synthase (Cx14CxxC type)